MSTDLVPAPQGEMVDTATGELVPVAPAELARPDPYAGASAVPITREEGDALVAPFPDSSIAVRPHDGAIYISHPYLRERLNEILGVGQWAMIPQGPPQFDRETSTVTSHERLVIRGAFASESVGECRWIQSNDRMTPTQALEGASSDALHRCCKRIGMMADLWKPGYADQWRARGDHVARPAPDTRPDPQPTPANGPVVVPACPICSGPMYDNRSKNDKLAALPEYQPGPNGEKAAKKLPPDWRCRDYKDRYVGDGTIGKAGCAGVYWRGQWPKKAEPAAPAADPRRTLLKSMIDSDGLSATDILAACNRCRAADQQMTRDNWGELVMLEELEAAREALMAVPVAPANPVDPFDRPDLPQDASGDAEPAPTTDDQGDPFPDSPEAVYTRLSEAVAEHAESQECRVAFHAAKLVTRCSAQTLDALLNRKKPGPGDIECLKEILGALGVQA